MTSPDRRSTRRSCHSMQPFVDSNTFRRRRCCSCPQFCTTSDITSIPGIDMFVGQLVTTPYGEGVILMKRGNDLVVQPSSWLMAGGQKATFYMNPKDVKPVYSIGAKISCTFGAGVVTAVRDEDCMYVVTLENWKLADGFSPTLFLNQAAISKPSETGNEDSTESSLDAKKIAEFDQFISKAAIAKAHATEAFKKSDVEAARLKYMTALETLQHVQGELTNKQKSILFEQTVTCNNNVALCSMRLKEYSNCIAFATNSLVLIRSLEKNIPDGKIWNCLLENGLTLDKLRKEWKKKSLFFIGKAQLKRSNYAEALQNLQEALSLIEDDAKLVVNANELKDLINEASSKDKKAKQKEKATWSKAFQKSKQEESSMYHEPSNASKAAASSTSPSKKSIVTGDINDPSSVKIDLDDLGLGNKSSSNSSKKKDKSSKKSVSKPIAQDVFAQYGLFIGFSLLTAALGGTMWWLRYRRR